VIGGILIAIELSRGAEVGRAIGGVVILLAFGAGVLIFQTRSETVRTVAGDPVDERWKHINEQALVGSANIAAVVALVGFGVCEATGRDNWQFALMAAVIGLTYLGGLIWHRGRM
jgi:hypothetical protein